MVVELVMAPSEQSCFKLLSWNAHSLDHTKREELFSFSCEPYINMREDLINTEIHNSKFDHLCDAARLC